MGNWDSGPAKVWSMGGFIAPGLPGWSIVVSSYVKSKMGDGKQVHADAFLLTIVPWRTA